MGNLDFTDDVLLEVFSNVGPSYLLQCLTVCSKFKNIIFSSCMLAKLSNDYGLPYKKGYELVDLCKYYVLLAYELVKLSSKQGNKRVIKFYYES